MQANIYQETQSGAELFQYFLPNGLSVTAQFISQATNPLLQLIQAHAGDLSNVFVINFEMQAFFLESLPLAIRACPLNHEGICPSLKLLAIAVFVLTFNECRQPLKCNGHAALDAHHLVI